MKQRFPANSDNGAPGAFLLIAILVVVSLMIAGACLAQEQSVKHTISVKFDYDFKLNHACSPTVTTNCVMQFNVYDISSKPPTKLFSIPVPAGATGPVKGITGESQPLVFEPGKHLLAARAELANGKESKKHACEVWIEIP
ncbi:MAG: hypothetical protein WB987_04750 [Candidatus Acidiferrales bacterium]